MQCQLRWGFGRICPEGTELAQDDVAGYGNGWALHNIQGLTSEFEALKHAEIVQAHSLSQPFQV